MSSAEVEHEDPRLVGTDRVLAVLTELANHPSGVGLDQLAREVGSPKPTVHRALKSLRRAGFAEQNARGHYVLGNELIRMAFAYNEAMPDYVRVQGILEQLAARWGETVHYAVLDGRSIIYRAKTDPFGGGVRLTSTVGDRIPAHATAVGKMLLSDQYRTLDELREWAGDEPLAKVTAQTKSTVEELHAELETIRAGGYSVDDQESEIGINCIAVPVYLLSSTRPSGAISITALAFRTPLQALINDLPAIRQVVAGEATPEHPAEA